LEFSAKRRDPGEQHLHPEPIADQPTDFGSPGWSHSWSWKADYADYVEITGEDTDNYTEWYTMMLTITFPDGHASKFKIFRSSRMIEGTNWAPDAHNGPPYIAAHGESTWGASGEIHDHLERMEENGSEFWLFRADGGSVHFFNDNSWGYQAREVFDPHGLLTTLHYNTEGNLDYVEQDGGRRLTIRWDCYSPPGQQNTCMQKVIGRVDNAGSGSMQAVEYGYSWLGNYLTLTYAYYQNDPVPGQSTPATYTYATYVAPEGFFPAGPLLVTADDPRFPGPMRQIRYTYSGAGCRPQGQPDPPGYPGGKLDYFYGSPTGIASEQSWRTYHNTTVPIIVSSFTLGCFDGTRSESNGLGGFRKFFYGHSAGAQGDFACLGYELAKVTEFTTVNTANGLPADLPFERQNYVGGDPRQIWDGRGILTEALHLDGSGLPSEIRHVGALDGSSYKYDRIDPQNQSQSQPQDFNRVPNPYHHWLFSKTDERQQKTTYTRDPRRRVTHIGYHGGSAAEDFTYDPLTNQVATHTLASGAVQHYDYNTAHQLEREWNSWDGLGEATIYTYYGGSNHPEWTGLVATVLNPRAAASGATYSTKMEYNGRFQITKVHYPPTGANIDPTVTYGYDPYGNCTSIKDEMGHTSLYEYDDYRRCISYTEPLNASNWNGSGMEASRRWDWIYDRDIDVTGQRDA
jgi:YD repeat-containing protein